MKQKLLQGKNIELKIEEFFNYVIIVEGKKDILTLKATGFQKVYSIHETSVPLRERVSFIMSQINKKDKVCILTDFDKKGKQLYLLLKTLFQEQGAHLDSTLRGLLLKEKISHIEGLYHYLRNNNY